MKKLLLTILTIFMCCVGTFADTLLKGSVEKVPNTLFGIWRVKSELIDTNSPATFKQDCLDIWNIIEDNNVMILSNPFSGAKAQVQVTNISDNKIEFIKEGKRRNQTLKDKVTITITGDTFYGSDELELETHSDVDNSIIKTEDAKYTLQGERIGGQEIK